MALPAEHRATLSPLSKSAGGSPNSTIGLSQHTARSHAPPRSSRLRVSPIGELLSLKRISLRRERKPLVGGEGFSKLIDFGIAARAGDRAIAARTLAYAPPEQFAGALASPAGDVYAATATFYECLTGHPPFTGGPPRRCWPSTAPARYRWSRYRCRCAR
jgi:hypothetical protein